MQINDRRVIHVQKLIGVAKITVQVYITYYVANRIVLK